VQIPIDNSGILHKVSRSSSLCHKGHAPSWVTPWIALGLSQAQVGLRDGPSRIAPYHLHYRATSQNVVGLVPLWYMVVATPQTHLVWSHKTTCPFKYNNGVRKHRVVRGMQTSLNTRPKPTTSA
jgi:hypothetical protein